MRGPVDRFNFTLKQLRYVEAAGRLGSIASAAGELNISQSSITSAIDALETEVGFDLFIRTRAKGLKTTSSGDQIIQMISNFIQHARQFEVDVKNFGKLATGSVRIAIYGATAPSFLPVLLESITNAFPQISIKILEGTLNEIVDYIGKGEADLAFTYELATDARHDFIPLLRAPPYALFSVNDPRAAQDFVTLEELSEHPLVLLDLPVARYYFMSLYEDQSLKPNIAHSTHSSEIGRALVAAGFGHTLLNMRPPGYQDDDPRFRAVPIQNPSKVPVFGVATIHGTRQPEVVRTFIEHCVQIRDAGAFQSLIIEC